MSYEQKPGEGVIFANDKKGNDKAPDIRGTFTDENGVKKEIAGWKKTSQNGGVYWSCKIKKV